MGRAKMALLNPPKAPVFNFLCLHNLSERRELRCKANQYWVTVDRKLAVAAVTLVMALVLLPRACAAEYKLLYRFEVRGAMIPDSPAEHELLRLANESRARAGLPPLKVDEGLTAAAREHAEAMARKRQLSHQLEGEPPLTQRLARSALQLARVGENVAYDVGVEQAHRGLMHSPPHRANLLNASYNVVGFAAVRNGCRLYVVQDFAHSVPAYSSNQAEEITTDAIQRLPKQGGESPLQARHSDVLEEAACSMAKQDRLETHSLTRLNRPRYILSYNTMQPEVLAPSTTRAMEDGALRSFSLGVCFSRTPTYPNGAYWIAVLFY